MSILKIKGPQFEATIDFEKPALPWFLEYMHGWSLFHIVQHCAERGWDSSYTDPRGIYGSCSLKPTQAA